MPLNNDLVGVETSRKNISDKHFFFFNEQSVVVNGLKSYFPIYENLSLMRCTLSVAASYLFGLTVNKLRVTTPPSSGRIQGDL
jgi:hypothetical protein